MSFQGAKIKMEKKRHGWWSQPFNTFHEHSKVSTLACTSICFMSICNAIWQICGPNSQKWNLILLTCIRKRVMSNSKKKVAKSVQNSWSYEELKMRAQKPINWYLKAVKVFFLFSSQFISYDFFYFSPSARTIKPHPRLVSLLHNSIW